MKNIKGKELLMLYIYKYIIKKMFPQRIKKLIK